MKRIALAFLLLAAPAMAQEPHLDTVMVNGHPLVGLWRIDTPRTPPLAPCGAKLCWYPLQTRFCHVTANGEDLAAACFNSSEGRVEIEGDRIHFAWGSMLAREVLDATLESATRFQGSSGLKLTGVLLGSNAVTIGTKLNITPDMPDKAGKAGMLAAMLAPSRDGVPSVPQEHIPPLPPAMRALGALKTLTYLGEADEVVKKQLLIFSVYQADFANGQRLCGLHQRDDGVLNDFRCD